MFFRAHRQTHVLVMSSCLVRVLLLRWAAGRPRQAPWPFAGLDQPTDADANDDMERCVRQDRLTCCLSDESDNAILRKHSNGGECRLLEKNFAKRPSQKGFLGYP